VKRNPKPLALGGLFFNPFFMKYRIKVLKPIKAEKTKIGIGAIILLRCASKPIINLLRRQYNEEKTCIIGNVDFLFYFDGIGIEERFRDFKP